MLHSLRWWIFFLQWRKRDACFKKIEQLPQGKNKIKYTAHQEYFIFCEKKHQRSPYAYYLAKEESEAKEKNKQTAHKLSKLSIRFSPRSLSSLPLSLSLSSSSSPPYFLFFVTPCQVSAHPVRNHLTETPLWILYSLLRACHVHVLALSDPGFRNGRGGEYFSP